MNADDSLLAMLDASPTLAVVPEGEAGGINAVYQGFPTVDTDAKVIALELPYLVYVTSPGYDRDERYCGSVGGQVLDFQLTAVGESEKQVKWILEEARKVLNRKRLGRALIKRRLDNDMIRPDENFTRPGGAAIFVCAEKYGVAT